MPVDEQDNPIVDIKELPQNINIDSYKPVSFNHMLQMNKKEEWDALFIEIHDKDVYITDDVIIENPEMEQYKNFYLRAYYYNILKHSHEAYVKH